MAQQDRDYLDEKLDTAVPATPVAGSLNDFLSKAAGGNTFNKATDSLEALADGQLSVGTNDINATVKASINTEVDGALNTIVPTSPTTGSLNDVLSKAAGGNAFVKATDSLEALSDKLGAFSGDGGAVQDDSAKASLDLVHTEIAVLPTDADVNAACDTALNDYDPPTKTEMDSGHALLATAANLTTVLQEVSQRNVPKCAFASTYQRYDTTGYEDVVNITDKGVLTGIFQRGLPNASSGYGVLKITIDGTVILTHNNFSFISVTIDAPVSLSFNHRFNTSLRVQHGTTDAGEDISVVTTVSYTTD